MNALGTFAAIRELETEDMVVDLNDGEFVPRDQIVRDPDHLEKLDHAKVDVPGCLRLPRAALSRHEEAEEERLE